MMASVTKRINYLILFAMAMGFMESAIVIYLRELLYPAGFKFPLTPIPYRLARVEILREAATVIMLICAGYLAGRTKLQRFAFFSLAFAVWDLCYYLFLYIFLEWPESPATWDILFLIPFPWVGPVWAPCLLSMLMLTGSILVIRKSEQLISYRFRKSEQLISYRFRKWEWFALIGGAIICIFSFMLDFLNVTRSVLSNSVVSSDDLFTDVHSYIPQDFNTLVFFTGFLLMLGSTYSNIYITNKTKQHEKE